jgi:hypothetical protein
MPRRIRHCVECPKCHTRYLIGASPYANGSYLVSSLVDQGEALTLYCSCGRPALTNRWDELATYAVSRDAHGRGFGPPEEVVREYGEER